MKHYLEHRCTACDTVVGGTSRRRAALGRPFAECPSCGAFVRRPPFDEWALMSPASRLELVLDKGALVLAAGLGPAVVYGLTCIALRRPSDVRVLFGVAAAGLVLAVAVWSWWMAHQVRRSKRRMGDPLYQAKLVEFGLAERP